MFKKICALMSCLWLVAALAAADEDCDRVNALAGDWAEIAEGVDEMAADGLTQAELDEAESLSTPTYEATRDVAALLAQQPEAHWVDRGRQLTAALDAVDAHAEAGDVDALLGSIDDMVALLDDILEACHRETQAAPAPPGRGPAPSGGAVRVSYEPAPSREYQPLIDALARSRVFEDIADEVMENLVLPVRLDVVFASCGTANAAYDPSKKRIVMCYELFAEFDSIFSYPDASPEEVLEGILGAGSFVLLHEIGHALVDVLEIPITGREEDSVDGLAAWVLLQGEREADVFAAIEWFDAHAAASESGQKDLPFWDEHSLNSQRVYDVACVVYGSDPKYFADLVGPDGLPEERAVRCPREYQQKEKAWDQLLAPHYPATH